MDKNRTEAFSDGVIAIIITIMVLELHAPASSSLAAIADAGPALARYLLSFVYVGIYWVNHHALLDRVRRIDASALWANLHLLFWMSLIPYVTAWAGQYPMDPVPVALYGVILMNCALAFMLLSWCLQRGSGAAGAAWTSRKNRISVLMYALAVLLSLWSTLAGALIHMLLALIWLRPDVRQSSTEAADRAETRNR